MKLCDNKTALKRDEANYNPAYKYDLIFDVLTSSVSALTKKAELDLCGDKTTWGHGGFGERGSGLQGRIVGKPGKTKGGQTTILSDVRRCRPRAYVHRHKLHPRPEGFRSEGPNEVRMLMELIDPLIEGHPSDGRRQIFSEDPHMSFDNFYSERYVLQYAGERGKAITFTLRRDRHYPEIPGEFLHKGKTEVKDRSKAARWVPPIVAVKRVPQDDVKNKKGYVITLCSFQSTSGCNVASVNAHNQLSLYARAKQRGRGAFKREWAIEMNEARALYLGSYGRVDVIDHLIKNARMWYRSWKYWHAPMLHCKAMVVVTAYDMYLECAEGKLRREWRVQKPMDYFEFRERLSNQMLKYKPQRCEYPGDEYFRTAKRRSYIQRQKARIEDRRTQERPPDDDVQRVTLAQLKEATLGRRLRPSRICLQPRDLKPHIAQTHRLHNDNRCEVCGVATRYRCTLCDRSLYFFPQRGRQLNKDCFVDFHDESFFGLARCDAPLIN